MNSSVMHKMQFAQSYTELYIFLITLVGFIGRSRYPSSCCLISHTVHLFHSPTKLLDLYWRGLMHLPSKSEVRHPFGLLKGKISICTLCGHTLPLPWPWGGGGGGDGGEENSVKHILFIKPLLSCQPEI